MRRSPRRHDDYNLDPLRQLVDHELPVLYVASHFVFEPGAEMSSFLLLGNGAHLTLREISDRLDLKGVDLITLSACETAVGSDTDANRQEIEGFGALARLNGARSVIATLWKIADGCFR